MRKTLIALAVITLAACSGGSSDKPIPLTLWEGMLKAQNISDAKIAQMDAAIRQMNGYSMEEYAVQCEERSLKGYDRKMRREVERMAQVFLDNVETPEKLDESMSEEDMVPLTIVTGMMNCMQKM